MPQQSQCAGTTSLAPDAVEEIGRRGQALYDQRIRARVEPENNGKFLVLDVETGDYEIDERHMAATKRLRARRPTGILYGIRIGYRTCYQCLSSLTDRSLPCLLFLIEA